ncbi:hypothetical protein Tco_0949607, partial [Tanacetum coccineum]
MAYSSSSSDSEVSNDSTCLKSCLETVKVLKSQYEQLLKRFEKSKLMVVAYKKGLQSVEERLEFYKTNESIYKEKIKGLKWEIQVGEITITELRKKLDIIQKEKDGIQLNVDKFENASKSLNKLIECQIVDKSKKGLGYNAVPPPIIGKFIPPTPDLSFTGLDEFSNEPVVEISKAKSSEEEPKVVRKSDEAPIIEEWVSDDEEEDVSQPKIQKKTVKPSFVKIDFVKAKQTNKTTRKTVKQVDCNYQRVVKHVWNNAKRVNHQNVAKKTHPCLKRNIVPRAVLMKSGLVSLNTDRQVNTAHPKITVNSARPMSNFSKSTHLTIKRLINKYTTSKNSNFNQRVNNVRVNNVNTAKPKAVVNAVRGNSFNAVKALAYWVWRPKQKVLDHVSKHNSALITLKKFDYIVAQGRSKSVMAWV